MDPSAAASDPQRLPGGRPAPRIRLRWVVALGLFVVAAAGAAYYDWVWWEPYNSVLPLLAFPTLLVVALVLASRRRARPLALALAATGVGIAAGHFFGPSRPALVNGVGTVTVSLTSPGETTGSASTTCATNESSRELIISSDPNLRLDIFPDNPAAPADIDQREFLSVSVSVGDRWERTRRADATHLLMVIGRVEGDLPETRMVTGPESDLEIEWTSAGGVARFARLVLETGTPDRQGEPVDLAGVVEWQCGPV